MNAIRIDYPIRSRARRIRASTSKFHSVRIIENRIFDCFATPKQQPKWLSIAAIECGRPPISSVCEFNFEKVLRCRVRCGMSAHVNEFIEEFASQRKTCLHIDRRTLKYILVVWQIPTKSSKYP